MTSVIKPVIRQIMRRVLPPYFVPVDLFNTGQQGVWYVPSDYSTLFQDSTGTTPVTAVGQLVGLMLDKSKGLVLGPELVTNGDFSSGTTGWTCNDGTISVVDGSLRVQQGELNDFTRAYQAITCTIGTTYKISGTLTGKTAANAALRVSTLTIGTGTGVFSQNISAASGSFSGYFTATASTMYVWALVNSSANNVYADFDNISVRELPGNHAFQATAGSRPTLALQSNQLHLSGGSINWTAPAGTYTVAYLADTGPTILTSQSLSGATNVMAVSKIFEYVAVDRALTAAENQGLLDYFDLKGRYL